MFYFIIMKKIAVILSLVCLYYVTNFIHGNRYELTYKFISTDSVSEANKIHCINILKKRLAILDYNAEVKLKSKNEIGVFLDAGFEVKAINEIVENTGKLDFWHCLKDDELLRFLREADKKLTTDSLANPIFSLVKTIKHNQLPIISVNDTLKVMQLLRDKRIVNLYDGDLKFMFDKPTENFVTLYVVNTNKKRLGAITEKSIKDVQQTFDQLGNPSISINMTRVATSDWEKMTRIAFQNNTKIAIVFNDVVYSAPRVMSPILGGRAEISGGFTIEETKALVSVLSGKSRIPKLKFTSLKKVED